MTDRFVAIWLGLCCIMVIVMVLVGGLTRLTNSGLSITEWRPITGILPPLGNEEWIKEKKKYELTAEFRELYSSMNINDFKKIYFIEYYHRLLARLLGLIFFLPCLYFFLKKRIFSMSKFLLILLVMLAQGVVGWYMVRSGLFDDPKISHLRLTLHLMMAALVFYLILQQFFKYSIVEVEKEIFIRNRLVYFFLNALPILFVLQMMFGGFMAGLNAGLIYNTFPLMNGTVFPEEILQYKPLWTNFLYNPTTVQFMHRMIPVLIVLKIVFIALNTKQFHHIYFILLLVSIQFIMGVLTLLYFVPVVLASMHQIFAFIVFSYVIYSLHYFKLAKKNEYIRVN